MVWTMGTDTPEWEARRQALIDQEDAPILREICEGSGISFISSETIDIITSRCVLLGKDELLSCLLPSAEANEYFEALLAVQAYRQKVLKKLKEYRGFQLIQPSKTSGEFLTALVDNAIVPRMVRRDIDHLYKGFRTECEQSP